jgi:hypothetical protein
LVGARGWQWAHRDPFRIAQFADVTPPCVPSIVCDEDNAPRVTSGFGHHQASGTNTSVGLAKKMDLPVKPLSCEEKGTFHWQCL